MFHLSRSCGFMCHAARQRSSRFDLCASVTVVFSSKQADHSMSVSDRRGKATRRRPSSSTTEARTFKGPHEKPTRRRPTRSRTEARTFKGPRETPTRRRPTRSRTTAPSMRDGSVPKKVVQKRPQGAGPRVPGRKQDRGTDLVSKATRRRPTRSRKEGNIIVFTRNDECS